MKRIAVALLLLAGLAFAAGPAAHEGHTHRVMGTVKAVDAAQMEIETKDGAKVTAQLTQDTKYRRGKAAATADEVKPGDRVVVSIVEKEGRTIALEVLLPPAEGGPKKP